VKTVGRNFQQCIMKELAQAHVFSRRVMHCNMSKYGQPNRWEICRRWPKNRGQKQSSLHLIVNTFKTKQKVSKKLF
jgi:hypothetical protein